MGCEPHRANPCYHLSAVLLSFPFNDGKSLAFGAEG